MKGARAISKRIEIRAIAYNGLYSDAHLRSPGATAPAEAHETPAEAHETPAEAHETPAEAHPTPRGGTRNDYQGRGP
jgi:hypothetical protein